MTETKSDNSDTVSPPSVQGDPPMSRGPLFLYVRDERQRPIACIAYTLDRSNNCIRYHMSTHNPIQKFDRVLARTVALGRFLKHPKEFFFDVDKANLDDIIHDLAYYLCNCVATPRRVRQQLNRHYKFDLDKKFLSKINRWS